MATSLRRLARTTNRHAALDALSNLCLKNWTGFTEAQRQEVCSSLTRNFVAHWRTFASTALPSSDAAASATFSSQAPAERKVLASATRGLACAVGKGGVSSVLEPYLARVVHALNHLVQPAGDAEKAAVATAAARGGGGGSNSGSRSRSRGRGFGHGGGGASPTRWSGSSSSLADPRARVRLQALTLLEAIAAKNAKSLYPHWALFFAPCGPRDDDEEAGIAGGEGGG